MWGTHLSSSREWMKLGPVIQSEVSKKEKRMSDINAYIYIYNLKKNGTDEPLANQQWKHRYRRQTCGGSGGRRGQDELAE